MCCSGLSFIYCSCIFCCHEVFVPYFVFVCQWNVFIYDAFLHFVWGMFVVFCALNCLCKIPTVFCSDFLINFINMYLMMSKFHSV